MMREYTVFNNVVARVRIANADWLPCVEAYYVPSRDFISMPAFAGFKGADYFYHVAFHELVHWTGHKSRLGRDLKNRFGATSGPWHPLGEHILRGLETPHAPASRSRRQP
jgi:antirestriction protein ArdC